MSGAILGLSGCVSSPPQASPENLTNTIGRRFAGQPITVMMSAYGAPARQIQVQGETVYSWDRSNVMTFQTQPPVRVSCQLDAYVSAAGIVRTIGLSGQNGACPQFAP